MSLCVCRRELCVSGIAIQILRTLDIQAKSADFGDGEKGNGTEDMVCGRICHVEFSEVRRIRKIATVGLRVRTHTVGLIVTTGRQVHHQ